MEPIAKYLSELIRAYVRTRYDGNIKQAAASIDADYNTVYRLFHEGQNSVSFFAAYDLLKALRPDDFRVILADFFPSQIATILEFANPNTDPMESIAKKFRHIFGSDLVFKVFLHASKSEGVSLAIVKEEFGNHGLSAVDELISLGIVKNLDDTIFCPLGISFLNTTEDVFKAHAHKNLDVLRTSIPGTMIKNHFAAVNEEGVIKLFAILDQASEQVREVMGDEKYRGSLIFLTSLAGGPLPSEKGGKW